MQTLRVREGGNEAGHGGEVFCCVYSRDGVFVLSAGWDGCLRLWHSADAQLVTFLQAELRPLSSCAFAPDGTAWLSGSMDGVLSWWDVVSHQQLSQLVPHIRPISTIQFSPDGRYLATASWDRKLLLRRLDNRDPQDRTLSGHQDIVAGCRWSAESKQLLSWSHDGTLRLWDADSASQIAMLEGHAERVSAACLSRDGQWAVSGSRDGAVKLWDLRRYEEARSVQAKGEIRGCWYLGDGASVLTVDADGWLAVWSLPALEVQTELATSIRPLCGDLSPSANELVLGSETGQLHFVALEGAEEVPLLAAATPSSMPWSEVISRFLSKRDTPRPYRYTCPACSHVGEIRILPDESFRCPCCNRLLGVNTKVPQCVGVSNGGGILVHKSVEERFAEKSTPHIRELTMKESLTPAQEEEAQALAQALARATYDDLLRMARALVASDTASLFGDTEFTIRDISHDIAAKAYRQHLEQKKTATKAVQ